VLERHPKVNFIGQARAWWCNVEEFLKRHQDKLRNVWVRRSSPPCGSRTRQAGQRREADEAVAL
jgi:hypothetical protein